MTASRTCRACGAALPQNVMWCLRCYEPVRLLTPREPQLPSVHLIQPEEQLATSRWQRGATSFGPAGRLSITAVVLLLAPWSINPLAIVVVWPAYLFVATLVLRDTWKRDFVETTSAPSHTAAPGARPPEPRRTPIPRATVVAWAILGCAVLGVLVASELASDTGRVLIDMAAIIAGLVVFLRWAFRGGG